MKKISLLLLLMAMAVCKLCICGCVSGDDGASAKDSTILADKIIKQIRQGKNISLKDKHILGVLDFTKVSPSNKKLNVSTSYVPSEICFVDCVFHDSVITYRDIPDSRCSVVSVFDKNVCFQNCQFSSDLVMRQTDFRGRFDFDLCRVNGNSDFSGSHFSTGISFCQANFDGDAMFVSCNFYGRANFFKVFFRNSLVMQYVRFNDIAMFSDAHFYGVVDMSKMFAASTVDFANSKFSGGFSLTNSQFLGDLRLVACQFSDKASLLNNQLVGLLNLRKAQFLCNTTIIDNVLYTEPDSRDCIKADSVDIIQQNNKTVNLIVKQII